LIAVLAGILGYKGIEGSEAADQLARKGSLHPRIGPELTCNISERVAKWAIGEWVCRECQEYWKSIPGQRQTKSFLSKLFAKGMLSL
jgi:hypothetical protein